ncbi:Glutamine dumper 3 [Rhynchospora pubera]|uniref:Glutamine dumper 3 n=1 Tax=Rhynchospora pubera TaxID=906938 RepID=A0AAV8GZV9_9POAL|nr:Glutamine dumper 3 [Rhynchospora pubera]
MRPGPIFTEAYTVVTTSPPPSTSAMAQGLVPHSTWRSPVPYLFGGLAAMMGVIALALLILACSYWKLSGFLDSVTSNEESSSGTEGEKGSNDSDVGPVVVQTEHVAVIMAGQERPTYLATPVEKKKEESVSVVATESNEGQIENSENLRVEVEERGVSDTSPEEAV